MDFSKEVPTLPSDSDDSDEDYVPRGAESDPPSEVESDGDDEVPDSDEESQSSKKRKKNQKGTKKKAKTKGRKVIKTPEKDSSGEEEEAVGNKVLSEEEEKKRSDSLWADFMKDTKPVAQSKKNDGKSLEKGENRTSEKDVSIKTELAKKEKKNKVTVTEVFKFAGEEVKITKEVEASLKPPQDSLKEIGSGSSSSCLGSKNFVPATSTLSAFVGKLEGKKKKLGTLEKSKLDWDRFKKTEGIEDELKTFNRGKDGYLEKQDFLQRTDLRQFEIEKGLRATRRSNR